MNLITRSLILTLPILSVLAHAQLDPDLSRVPGSTPSFCDETGYPAARELPVGTQFILNQESLVRIRNNEFCAQIAEAYGQSHFCYICTYPRNSSGHPLQLNGIFQLAETMEKIDSNYYLRNADRSARPDSSSTRPRHRGRSAKLVYISDYEGDPLEYEGYKFFLQCSQLASGDIPARPDYRGLSCAGLVESLTRKEDVRRFGGIREGLIHV
ncbi:MAG: hypothetical protein AB7G93_07500 [Bdellovibrionales bacterium]